MGGGSSPLAQVNLIIKKNNIYDPSKDKNFDNVPKNNPDRRFKVWKNVTKKAETRTYSVKKLN